MGTYYRWMCDEMKAYLDPESFGEPIKSPQLCPNTLFGLALLMRNGSWRNRNVRLVSDDYSDYFRPEDKGGWTDAYEETTRL